jgi:hypothetical protein
MARSTKSGGSSSWTDKEWLALWQEMGNQGRFKGEPDFPMALSLFQDALGKQVPRPPEMEWLIELTERVIQGKPAATEAEYMALAEWYRRNEANLYDVNIRCRLSQDAARRIGATELSSRLKSLRAAHPELS